MSEARVPGRSHRSLTSHARLRGVVPVGTSSTRSDDRSVCVDECRAERAETALERKASSDEIESECCGSQREGVRSATTSQGREKETKN